VAVTITQRTRRVTSRDVARLAGVSATTVSFVINDVPGVSIPEETRRRVHHAITQLDYHPNEAARSMGRRASRALGLVIPESVNPHYMEIAAGAEAYAERHGYEVALSITNFDLRRERRSLGWLKQQRCDALIVALAHNDALLDDLRALCHQGYPVTTLGFHDEVMDSVGPEREIGERLILTHLVEFGHRRVGYIHGAFTHDSPRDRLSTCLTIQRDLGVPVNDAWVRRCGPTQDDGYQATRQLLAACAGGERPTALVVVNDYIALSVLAALHEARVAVPDDMSVVSFDNTCLARYAVPALTSIDHHAHALGEQAAHLSIERIAAPHRVPVHLGTRAQLFARASSGSASPL